MKIGIIGTIWLNTPPTGYGGTEQVVYNIAEGLVKNGHDVTLFGPATAKTSAHLIPTVDIPLREQNISWENISYPTLHLSHAYDMAEQFDILHMHLNKNSDYMALPFSLYRNAPTLFTLHFRVPDANYKADRSYLLHKYRGLPFSSISNSQQRPDRLNYVANIYNSLNISDYPFNPDPEDYVVWLGKILPIKGTKEAILAAQKAKVKIIVMGTVEPGVQEAEQYFEEEVKPLIDNKTVFLKRDVTLPEKAKILGKATVLLNPIQWEEPFGLVMTEAQATGTPVIAFARGAAPEVIEDNKTGFLVHTVDEMAKKIKDVSSLKRQNCRDFVANTFSNEKMVNGYENAYQTVMQNWDKYTKDQWEINRIS